MRFAAFILSNGINILNEKENAVNRKFAKKFDNMLQKGYKYIVRLTRTVELYLCGGTLSNYMHACKVAEGTDEAKHAINVARALGYDIRYKRGVYYDIDDQPITYYNE